MLIARKAKNPPGGGGDTARPHTAQIGTPPQAILPERERERLDFSLQFSVWRFCAMAPIWKGAGARLSAPAQKYIVI